MNVRYLLIFSMIAPYAVAMSPEQSRAVQAVCNYYHKKGIPVSADSFERWQVRQGPPNVWHVDLKCGKLRYAVHGDSVLNAYLLATRKEVSL